MKEEALLEAVARAICAAHFNRKRHRGVGIKSDGVAYMVNRYWRGWLPDAHDALQAVAKVYGGVA